MSLILWLLAGCGAPPAEPVVQPPDVAPALERALGWLDAYPQDVRYDAIVGAHEIWELEQTPGWKALRDKRIAGSTDDDHEHRRFFDPAYRLEREQRDSWTIPGPGDKPANPNRVITEALYCAESGWRPEVEAYVCGAMRDQGGFYTAHALWALEIAQDNGCAKEACTADLVRELTEAQPAELAPERTLDIDLYAERLLMTCMVDCPEQADVWARTLLERQEADGSWGVSAPDENPYHRYHATMASAWALALWRAHRGS